jgi:predicted amino acid-binding ACT domain protein
MRQFATITVIGRDKTGVIARVTAFLFEQHANIEALEELVARGQQLEAGVLVKAVKLFLGKRLDVYWGVVKEV